jgi:hypothetical protein
MDEGRRLYAASECGEALNKNFISKKKMEIEQYQESLLQEMAAADYDELLPKLERAVETLKLVPGIQEIITSLAEKLSMETDVAYLILFSIELWNDTLAILKGGKDLTPLREKIILLHF